MKLLQVWELKLLKNGSLCYMARRGNKLVPEIFPKDCVEGIRRAVTLLQGWMLWSSKFKRIQLNLCHRSWFIFLTHGSQWWGEPWCISVPINLLGNDSCRYTFEQLWFRWANPSDPWSTCFSFFLPYEDLNLKINTDTPLTSLACAINWLLQVHLHLHAKSFVRMNQSCPVHTCSVGEYCKCSIICGLCNFDWLSEWWCC